MFRRVLILCLLITVPLSGCTAPQRTDSSDVLVFEDGTEPYERPRWYQLGRGDGPYGALMCAGYLLILAAAAGGAWALVAAQSSQPRGNWP